MLILLLLAEAVTQPADNLNVRKGMMNMARCVHAQIDQLDDGVSDARTIAQAATAGCGGARGLLRKSWVKAVDDLATKFAKKSGEPVTEAEKNDNVEQAMSNLDASLAKTSVRWVLQKRAGQAAQPAAPPSATEPPPAVAPPPASAQTDAPPASGDDNAAP